MVTLALGKGQPRLRFQLENPQRGGPHSLSHAVMWALDEVREEACPGAWR